MGYDSFGDLASQQRCASNIVVLGMFIVPSVKLNSGALVPAIGMCLR
jgi:hypothetical protein